MEQRAIRYLEQVGWKAPMSTGRLLQEADLIQLKHAKHLTTVRPRGILSGFLVIAPGRHGGGGAVFVPPWSSANARPQHVQLRLSGTLWTQGAVFSCYQAEDLVLEDVLVWAGQPLFKTLPFEERWRYMEEFVGNHWQPDDALQGRKIRVAEYRTLEECREPEELQVLEFVPNAANAKRLVWIPTAEDGSALTQVREWIARRESGPDLFSLWSPESGEKQPNLALVRTLAVSKLLRGVGVSEFAVETVWNKPFSRWEITGLSKKTRTQE
jgi:hypothetical protein